MPIAWEVELPGDSLGGLAAAEGVVVAGGRDLLDTSDLFVCWDAVTGAERWRYQYPALPPAGFSGARDGKLDFGNSPRATPAIVGEWVVTAGAFGDVACLNIRDGKVRWKLNLLTDYGGELPTWGFAGSPLVVDRTLYVQPAAEDAALAAIDLDSGDERWVADGFPPGYASLLVVDSPAGRQLVGWDMHGAVGWRLEDGRRLWNVPPQEAGEFLVPSPVALGAGLLLVGETNGARLHHFDAAGGLQPEPSKTFPALKADSHTPTRIGRAVVGVHGRLWSLDAISLAPLGFDDDPDLGEYSSLVSDGSDITLLLTVEGNLVLHRFQDGIPQQVAKRRLTTGHASVYAHPAFFDRRMVCRLGTRLVCYELER